MSAKRIIYAVDFVRLINDAGINYVALCTDIYVLYYPVTLFINIIIINLSKPVFIQFTKLTFTNYLLHIIILRICLIPR